MRCMTIIWQSIAILTAPIWFPACIMWAIFSMIIEYIQTGRIDEE
jgi:hypothetical protein